MLGLLLLSEMSSPSTSPSHHLHITFTSPAHHLHITFTSPLHHLHITFTSPSHHLHITCTSPSHHLHITCTSPAHHLHITFTSPSHHLHITFLMDFSMCCSNYCDVPISANHIVSTIFQFHFRTSFCFASLIQTVFVTFFFSILMVLVATNCGLKLMLRVRLCSDRANG